MAINFKKQHVKLPKIKKAKFRLRLQQYSQSFDLIILFRQKMNFLQLLSSGASFLGFNFQSKTAQSVEGINKGVEKQQGFKKVQQTNEGMETLNQFQQQLPSDQANILNHILYNQRQQLINRYLQLNLQLLEGKISHPVHQQNSTTSQGVSQHLEERELSQQQQKNNSSKKKIKKQVKCGHDDKAHYAKGLCNNCYHKYGRTKKPWNCPHEKLYAGGMCQNCYINMYNRKKREETVIQDQKNESSKGIPVILLSEKSSQKRQYPINEQQK